jgi:uncharacterized protein YcbX
MSLTLSAVEVPGAVATVAELISYPVKSCAGVPLTEALLTEAGLAHDRTFMVVDADGVFRSQRRDPLLAVVQPALSEDGALLTLGAPNVEDLSIEVALGAARRDVLLFGNRYHGIDQGGAVAEWLSSVLGRTARLVRVPPEHQRVTDGWTRGTSAYADSSPIHAISRATLRELNRRLAGAAVPMSRFRPNIVIDGWECPHMEDQARRVRMGNAELGYAKLAIRCAVALVDQGSGVKAGPEPIRTLATYRRMPGDGVAFGAKFSVLQTGKLTVGDEATVLSWAWSELYSICSWLALPGVSQFRVRGIGCGPRGLFSSSRAHSRGGRVCSPDAPF